jgi:predicted N-formylglutamate amidohydrolase
VAAGEPRILVTCEHGGCRVPPRYRSLFRGKGALLRSHRGWDPGAREVACRLARALEAPLIAATTTRLLVDLNRSPHNPRVFSKLTRVLPPDEREALLARYHRPHWDRVRAALDAHQGVTLHIAVHSFTPLWNGERREFTIGLLYDPRRSRERELACEWKRRLGRSSSSGRVRRNAPYRGNADGLTAALRREHTPSRYLGLELELNQAAVSRSHDRRALVAQLRSTLADVIS